MNWGALLIGAGLGAVIAFFRRGGKVNGNGGGGG
jgi:hypothetical protein